MGRHTVLNVLKPVGIIAAISSGIQGVIWACFYLGALLIHYCLLKPDSDKSAYTFTSYLAAYIQGSRCTHINLFCVDLIGPEQLGILLVFAVTLNFLQVTASIILIVVLIKSSKEVYYVFINTWIGVSIINMAIEVWLSIVFLFDYLALSESRCMYDRGLSGLATISLFIFSSHGILLLIANICFIIFFMMASAKLRKKMIKLSKLDLTSNWQSTSDSSIDIGHNFGDRNEIFGVLHQINETIYPEHTAKARWPYLNQRNSKDNISYTNDYINSEPIRLKRGEKHTNLNEINNITDHETINRQEIERNFIDNNQKISKTISEPDTILKTHYDYQSNQNNEKAFHKISRSENFNDEINYQDNHRKYLRNNNRFFSNTMPSRLGSIPVPPPLPPKNSFIKDYFDNNNRKIIPVQIEPDYTPPNNRKLFDINSPLPLNRENESFNFKKFPKIDDQKIKYRRPTSLHEAIKNRPPLKPVVQRMNTTEC